MHDEAIHIIEIKATHSLSFKSGGNDINSLKCIKYKVQ